MRLVNRARLARGALGVGVAMVASGCSNPLSGRADDALRRSVIESARRETESIRAAPALGVGEAPAARTVDAEPAAGPVFPPERLAELERMSGPTAAGLAGAGDGELDAGPDMLDGASGSPAFGMSLRQAIGSAVANNIDADLARIEPAISAAQLAAAQAAFDWVFFTSFDFSNIDRPQPAQVIGGTRVGPPAQVGQSVAYETGLRKPLTSGGQLTLSQGQTYSNDSSPDLRLTPDPSNAAQVTARLDQPLLRGFGADVATAEIRLNRNAERASVLNLQSTLIQVVTRTEQAYWRLVLAKRNLGIVHRLLDRGVQTRDVLQGRTGFDAKPAELSDAVATVERRRAALIRARNQLRQASDQLKLLVNDPVLTVASETLVDPTDGAADAGVEASLADAVTEAIRRRPEVNLAVLGIDDASIRKVVAANTRLPRLDLAVQAQFHGLSTGAGAAYEQVDESKFVDYLLGVTFEQPIGNGAAEAGYRQRRLEQMKSVGVYRKTVQQVVLEVKTALRNVRANRRLIEQTRGARLAAAENLRTLEVQEKTIQSLTPDFLDLKFRRQDALASAELDEAQAVVDYNVSLAELAQARGAALERNGIRFEAAKGE